MERQATASEHLAVLHEDIDGLRASNAEVLQRQVAAEERINAAMQKLQAMTRDRAAQAPAARSAQPEKVVNKKRVNEQGRSRDASPSASAAQTPRTAGTTTPEGAASVTFTPDEHQPRGSERRSSSVPARKNNSDKDEVLLLRFDAPHSSGFTQKWFPEEFPPHEVRILSFHDNVTLSFDDADSADTGGRILRQARPHIVLRGDAGTERVSAIRDRPPEVRRHNLGLHHVWEAIHGASSAKPPAIRPLHA